MVFLGMRGCDLEALDVLDSVNTDGQTKDPFYLNNRSDLLLIGADCTDCGKTCFCTSVNGKPYPTGRYDLNLTPVVGGFAVAVGSDKGKQLVHDNWGFFSDVTSPQQVERIKLRSAVTGKLIDLNRKFRLKLSHSDIHKINLENKAWKTLTKDCVECSSCNFICPTCTCFVLLDQKAGEGGTRDKVWDACLKSAYTKVAGGSNPRGKLYQRLQNRYQCKFDYSFDQLHRYTCVGCGRCIDGCAGNIDMRRIFVELEKQVPLTAKLK